MQQECNMNTFSRDKGCNSGTNPSHVEPLLIPLIKEIYNGKSDEDCFKLKLHIYPTYSTLNLHKFKISLFNHGNPKDFLLFMRNFNMILAATGTLEIDANIQYLFTLVRGEALHQSNFLSEIKNTESLNVDYYIKGLALYFSPVNSRFKTNRLIRRGMKNRAA